MIFPVYPLPGSPGMKFLQVLQPRSGSTFISSKINHQDQKQFQIFTNYWKSECTFLTSFQFFINKKCILALLLLEI